MSAEDHEKLRRELKELYDDHRTALLNVKYYSAQLVRYRRLNLALEIFLALTSSGSIAAWGIWKEDPGPVIWKVLLGATAILAVIKPFIQLSKSVERYQGLYAKHNLRFFDLDRIVRTVKVNRHFTEKMKDQQETIENQLREMLTLEDLETQQDEKLIQRLFEKVNKEYPPEYYWTPVRSKP